MNYEVYAVVERIERGNKIEYYTDLITTNPEKAKARLAFLLEKRSRARFAKDLIEEITDALTAETTPTNRAAVFKEVALIVKRSIIQNEFELYTELLRLEPELRIWSCKDSKVCEQRSALVSLVDY